MKSYDDFCEETMPMREAIGEELRQLVLSRKGENASRTDQMIMLVEISTLYTERLLRLYHSWLSQQQ